MTDIRIPDDLWRGSMLPEGVLERWLVGDRTIAVQGKAIAQVRIEDAIHDLTAPTTGRLSHILPAGAIVDPGALIGQMG